MTGYIFILCCEKLVKSIRIYENTAPFGLLMLIPLEEIAIPSDLVANPTSDCLYVADIDSSCIWKITTEGQVMIWLCNLTSIWGVSIAIDGKVVVLQRNKTDGGRFVEIFTSDAVLIRRIYLPNFLWIQNSFLKPDGQLITVHCSEDNVSLSYIISLAANNGQLIGLINLTSEGYFSSRRNRTALCWSIDFEVTHVINYDSASTYECFAAETDSFLMLEENIAPLDLFWRINAINKIILLDAQLEFGIHSSKNNVIIHKYRPT